MLSIEKENILKYLRKYKDRKFPIARPRVL